MTKHESGRPSYNTSMVAICKPMKRAGITDPDSPKGIGFCTEKCPYPYGCIVANEKAGTKKNFRIDKAKDLHKKGMSFEEIAVVLQKSSMTIRRYIKT